MCVLEARETDAKTWEEAVYEKTPALFSLGNGGLNVVLLCYVGLNVRWGFLYLPVCGRDEGRSGARKWFRKRLHQLHFSCLTTVVYIVIRCYKGPCVWWGYFLSVWTCMWIVDDTKNCKEMFQNSVVIMLPCDGSNGRAALFENFTPSTLNVVVISCLFWTKIILLY